MVGKVLSLLGIAFVVDDIHKGSKLVFRYPAPSQSSTSLASHPQMDFFHSLPPGLFAKLFRPKLGLCNRTFDLTIDDLQFISHPISLTKSDSDKSSHDTTMFNVVFALDKIGSRSEKDGGKRNRGEQGVSMFKEAACMLANALLHEERRCGYVSNEVRIMLHIREELAQNERGLQQDNSAGTDGEVHLDPQTLIDVALEQSRLANDLKDVYHGLNESGTVHVVIGRWVRVSVTLQDNDSLFKFPIRPYHTLLLLGDENKLLETLPTDSSPQLRSLIVAANPLRSFRELFIETGIPLNQLFRLGSHLVYWGMARVIDTLTKHNMYQVHPEANLDRNSPLALEFRRNFPSSELAEVLGSLSITRKLGEYMKNKTQQQQLEFIHMLIWLLQHNFVIQLHRYVHLMVPRRSEPPKDPSVTTAAQVLSKGLPTTGMSPSSSASVGMSLSLHEKKYLDGISNNSPTFKLLKRLAVFFHGRHHLEEIMWSENVTRAEVRAVLTAYKDIVVCSLHE